ncbi:MFS transporter [Candidatus Dependentiae bacterium]|nr:MFS transporter [Candidatus Dependentiae bacterium]
MKDKMLKPAILSVSLLTIMASAAVAPALGKIRLAFPEADATLIKLILTLPALMIIPFSLISGKLVQNMKKKTLMMIGLVIYLIAGFGGGFAQNIIQLLIIRGVLGIGVGIIMPLSTTLIGDFFKGDQRKKMMGLAGSVQNLGGVIFQIGAGFLAVISWRYAFGVYTIALFILILVGLFLPEPPREEPTGVPGQKPRNKLPIAVYVIAFLCILNMVVFFVMPTNLAMFLEHEKKLFTSDRALFKSKEDFQKHLKAGTISKETIDAFKGNGITLSTDATLKPGEEKFTWEITDKRKKFVIKKEDGKLIIKTEKLAKAAMAGYILSAMSLSAMFAGLLLVGFARIFRKFAIPIAILLMGLGYFLLSGASSIWIIFVAVVVIGFGFGTIQPTIFLTVQRIAPPNARAFAMAIVGSSIFLGQFISPIVMKGVVTIFNQDSFQFRFLALAFALGGAGILAIIISLFKPKKKATPKVYI